MPDKPNLAANEDACHPLTLCKDWTWMGRLSFMLACCFFGTIWNAFFVAAFFIESSLKKAGNVFLACIGVVDLVMTSVVMVAATIVLLTGQWENVAVCHFLQMVATSSTYCYSLYFSMLAAETFTRLCCKPPTYKAFISMPVNAIAVVILIISTSAAAAGVYLKLDYDYCERLHSGNVDFRAMTTASLYCMPFIFIMFCLITSCIHVIDRARSNAFYKRSMKYRQDFSSATFHTIAYFIFVVFWMPALTHIHTYKTLSDTKYYNFIWAGIIRSILTSFLYGIFIRNFFNAFANLFKYCFCKHNLPSTPAVRRRRPTHHNLDNSISNQSDRRPMPFICMTESTV